MPHTDDSWWEIDVSGDEHALRLLRETLDGPDVRVIERDGQHILRVAGFDDVPDAGVVRSRARTLVRWLSGSAQLVLGWPAPLEVGHVRRRHPGGRNDYFLEVDPARITIRSFPVTLRVTRSDGSVEEHRPGEEIPVWLQQAEQRESVGRVLRLIADPEPSWVELYRILEIIHEDAGSGILQWLSKSEFEQFKRTANSVGAVGDAARHGRERGQPPEKPMELPAARRMVLRVAKSWLSSGPPEPPAE